MDSIKIYSASGALLIDAVLEDTSSQDWGIMSGNQVALEFYTDECVILPASCYIEFDGQRFWLLEEYKPTENNSAEWAYQVRFLGAESLLSVTVVLNTTDNLDEPIFNLTAPASQHIDFIVKNLNRRFPEMNWRAGSVPETENIHIEYVGTYASDALQTIVGDKFEWWVDGYVVNVGRCEFGTAIELGYGKGLIGGITYSTANEMRSYAYLYPIGSTRNIDPAKYGHARLQLPNGQTRIDINPEQGLSELVEADAFASIFPRYVGKVTSVRTSTGKNSDGTTFLIYHIKDTAIPFNPNDYEIAGEVKHITFQSGELMGADFEVNYDANNKEFEIITQFLDEGLSQLPGGTLIPKTGDKYVVWNISMPDEYYPLAEQEFLQAALSFVQDSIKETSVYRASVDFIDLQERGLTLRLGQKVRLLSDEYFPQNGYYDSRITRIIRDIYYPDELIIEVSTVVTQGTISRLRTSVSDSATKVASLGQSLKNYVDVMSPQSVRGVKNFVNGLSIGGVGLWRHPDGYVYLDETLVLKGGVVMYGNSSGVNVPSIFGSLPIDGHTIKRDGNGALYVDETVLSISGGGGGGGVADSVHWNNVTGKPSWIGSTKPSYKYSEIEERPDLSVYFLASNFTTANIKTTLGISDWALASAKPTYKYDEISNTPDLSVYALNTDLAKKWTQNDAKIANWDSAYGWGNHANAGYAKASAVTNEFKNYVKLAGDAQSITAQHNFTNGLKIGGISLRRVDNYLYLDSPLVLSGGVTMYGDDGTTVKPIWESIPFDRSTIDWVNDKWTVVGGVGSGGIDETMLEQYLSEKKYATQSWVEGSYLSKSGGTVNGSITATKFIGALEGNAATATDATMLSGVGIDQMFKYAGYNTDLNVFDEGNYQSTTHYINSTDLTVTNAPKSYGSAVNFGCRVGNMQLFASNGNRLFFRQRWTGDWNEWKQIAFTDSNVASADDSSKLGGVAASRFLKGTGVIETADFNEQTAIGLYRYNTVTDKNSPADGTSYGNLLVLRSGGCDTLTQMYFNSSTKMQIFVRSGSTTANATSNFASREWKTIAFTSDIPTKLSDLTDDVVAGNYLPLSGGDVTGDIKISDQNSRTATYGATKIIFAANASSWASSLRAANSNGETLVQIAGVHASGDTLKWCYYGGTAYNSAAMYINADKMVGIGVRDNITEKLTVSGNVKATSFIGKLTGSADSATKLATPRTIWGQSFDGSADINSGINIKSYFTNGSVAKISDLGEFGLVVGTGAKRDDWGMGFWTEGNGNGYIQQQAFTSAETTYALCLQPFGGNVGIGTSSPSEKLSVSGNVKAAKFIGAVALNNNDQITSKDTGGTARKLLQLNTSNNLLIGQGTATQGYTTYLYGNVIKFVYGKNTGTAMQITSSGDVGIGTTEPSAKLHVNGTSLFSDDATFSSTVIIGDIPLYKSADGTIFLGGNLVLKGSLAMYGDGGTAMALSENTESRIAELELIVAQLQDEINSLKAS